MSAPIKKSSGGMKFVHSISYSLIVLEIDPRAILPAQGGLAISFVMTVLMDRKSQSPFLTLE